MAIVNLEKRIFPCITTCPEFDWKEKLKEAEKLGLAAVSFFPEFSPFKERKPMYPLLLKSKLKWIPHVHIRQDTEKWELDFFFNKLKTRFFNIHESEFNLVSKWPEYEKHIYLEYNYDDNVPKNPDIDIKKIAGLCIDFSHFWAAKNRDSREYKETIKNAAESKVGCNHLNGYSYETKSDLHYIANLKSFDYLKEISEKYFGEVITIEVNNSIEEQLKFKDYIIKLLSD